jgi:hypothetical protein
LHCTSDAAPGRIEVQELNRELFTWLVSLGTKVLQARAYDRSAQLLQAARELGAGLDNAALIQAEADLQAAREQNPTPAKLIRQKIIPLDR